MKRIFPIILLSLSLSTFAESGVKLPVINRQTIEAHIAFLASDALEGREAGKKSGRIAAEYIKAVLQASGTKPFYNDYFQPFEAYSAAEKRGLEPPKTYYVNPDSIAQYKREPFYHRLKLQNVVGYIEGEKADEFVVIGAHYDHVGVDETLVGDQIFNGADDNASGVAAVLQIAGAFAESGQKPLRSIIFAFWDGEEVNYLGSEYFVENFKSLSTIKAYINLDMTGREGLMPTVYPEFAIPQATKENTAAGNQFHLLYTEELSSVNSKLLLDIKANKLNATPKSGVLGHPSRGSDFLPFSQRKIPFLWFFTGLHPDYHTPADEIEKLDLDKVAEIAKAVYISLWHLTGK
jgi:Zn-dependent M28 family amino/carboxypeptidase